MDVLQKRLKLAARRMRDVHFVECLLQHLAFGLVLAAALVFVDKAGLVVSLLQTDWQGTGLWQQGALALPSLTLPDPYGMLFLALFLLAMLTAALRALARPFTVEGAALAMDERTRLKERLTSAATLGQRELAMAGVLVEDAAQHAAGLNPSAVFPYRGGAVGRRLPWLALGFLAILAFLPDLDLLGERARLRQQKLEEQKKAEEAKQIARIVRDQSNRLKNELDRRQIQDQKLLELQKKLQKLATEIPKMDPEEAQKQLNKLNDKMREEEKKDFSADRMQTLRAPREQRSLMKDAIQKMQNKDLEGAREAMRQLRRKLEKSEFDTKDLAQLSKEMKELSEQLEQLNLDDLGKSFKEAAEELKQLSELSNLNREKMREVMDLALKNLKGEELDLSKLTDEEKELLKKLQDALSKMEMSEQRLQAMKDAALQGQVRQLTMKELKDLLQQMKQGGGEQGSKCPACKGNGQCQKCNGTGQVMGPDGKPMPCPDCQGSGKCPDCGGSGVGGVGGVGLIPGGGIGGMGQGQGAGQGQGDGLGSGTGVGERPERENPTQTINTRIRARQLAQGMIDQMFVRGLPPGDAEVKMKYVNTLQEVEASRDSVREREHIPREDQELVKDYHNAIKGVE